MRERRDVEKKDEINNSSPYENATIRVGHEYQVITGLNIFYPCWLSDKFVANFNLAQNSSVWSR
jgi:hypothetical protein